MTEQLEMLLAELESAQLVVGLVPSRWPVNEGAMVRVAFERNCKWYRDFCARHLSSRVRKNHATDTRIKRREVLRILGRLAAGLSSRSKYAPELRLLAARKAAA